MKLAFPACALAVALSTSLFGGPVARAQQTSVPDAPAPQPARSLNEINGPITPGKGSNETPLTGSSGTDAVQQQAPTSSLPSAPAEKDTFQTNAPELPGSGEGFDATTKTLKVHVDFVEVPVTVKDNKGKLVPGLTWRDFKVFENNTREPLALFTVDPFPLSVAFVIDQSLTSDVMSRVNESLGAIQGALTPYDELAIFSYSNGSQERTGFTGAQSARVPAVLALTKATGSDMLVPVNSGPLAGCSIRQNGNCVDPNLQPGKSAGGSGNWMSIPKETHTLNDAILSAAKELSTRPKGRRRVIYVISDGKEARSKANYKEVLRYLQTNQIAVYGTAVGDSARWGEGYLSRFHLPLTMYENILYKYTAATGGFLDSETSINGIEKSYARIAEEARTQYTLGYYSHEPFIDGKFRKIDVRVNRPGLEILTKMGYFPNAQDAK